MQPSTQISSSSDARPRRVLLVLVAGVVILAASSEGCSPRNAHATSGSLADDEAIAETLGRELNQDSAVPPGVRFEVTYGIVRLEGEVDTLPAKERAGEIASLLTGVRAVKNEIQVRPVPGLSDGYLRRAVSRALLLDHKTVYLDLDVVAKDGKVTLHGPVASHGEAALALDVASYVRGVRALRDNMVVRGEARRDPIAIKAEIESRLRWDALVLHRTISVDVSAGGDVMLSGTVASLSEKSRAWQDAWVRGVVTLDAKGLRVSAGKAKRTKTVTTTDQPDEDVAEAIERAIQYHPRATGFAIDSSVEEGVVELHGAVDTLGARWAAAEVAQDIVGVQEVWNFIRVESARASDSEIEGRIRAMLKLGALTAPHEISVYVANQAAELRGTVDEEHEKLEAERLSAFAYGVGAVANHIRLRRVEQLPAVDPYEDDDVPLPLFNPRSRQSPSWDARREHWRWRNRL